MCQGWAEQLQLANKASGAECFSKDSVPGELAFPGAQSKWQISLSLPSSAAVPDNGAKPAQHGTGTTPAPGALHRHLPVWPGEVGSLKFTVPASHLFRSENVYSKDCGLID